MSNITLREALLCAMAQATDDHGLRLQSPELPVAIAVARAIEKHLGAYGYKISPISYEAPPEPLLTTFEQLFVWVTENFTVIPGPPKARYTWDGGYPMQWVEGDYREYTVLGCSYRTPGVEAGSVPQQVVVQAMHRTLIELRDRHHRLSHKPIMVVRRALKYGDERHDTGEVYSTLSLRCDFPELPYTWADGLDLAKAEGAAYCVVGEAT